MAEDEKLSDGVDEKPPEQTFTFKNLDFLTQRLSAPANVKKLKSIGHGDPSPRNRGGFQKGSIHDHRKREGFQDGNLQRDKVETNPVDKKLLKKYRKGSSVKSSGIQSNFRQKQWKLKEETFKFAVKQAARSEILLPEQAGYMDTEDGEESYRVTQMQIKDSVDITSAAKQYDLNLNQYGPYTMDYTRSGRHLLLGGRMGHVAAVDWVTKKLLNETNVMEKVYSVKWLHQETMYAVAQKDHVYMYDHEGTELHCLKRLYKIVNMEFLPYHFLLACGSDTGYLSWLDTSVGKMVTQFGTYQGRLNIMCQNPGNAVICVGDAKGTISMWTPNINKPVVQMLAHTKPLSGIAVDPLGKYMVTAGLDRSLKVWDIRNLKVMHAYKLQSVAGSLSFSQTGMLSVSLGNYIDIFKDITKSDVISSPYLHHRTDGNITNLQFCPYEDVLGVAHSRGFSSLLVPGAGEPNYDAYEVNPFQTKSQRRESEVKALLDKIQPELITIDSNQLAEVDRMTLEEQLEEKKKILSVHTTMIDVKVKKKKRGMKAFERKRVKAGQMRKEEAQTIKTMENQLGVNKDVKEDTQKPKTVLDRFNKKKK